MDIWERTKDIFGDSAMAAVREGLQQTGFFKIIEPERGNQTQVQIANGQLGGPADSTLVQRQSGVGLQGGITATFANVSSKVWFWPAMLITGAIGLALFLRRRK